jgi:putative peptidoglycan lipid II flippase
VTDPQSGNRDGTQPFPAGDAQGTAADAALAASDRSDGRLLRTSTVMAVGTTVSRALGFVRSATIAAAIGVHFTADTFTVANTVPNILYILLAGGVLNAVFVPQLVRAMKNPDGGQGYSDRLLTLAGLVLLGVTIAATALAPVLMAIYTGDDYTKADVAVATAFAFWCLPQIFFYGVYTLVGQVLNARDSFGPMMWAPIVNNVVAIAGALLFIALYSVDPANPSSLSDGAIALLGGTATLGVALQALVLIPVLRHTGFRYRPRFDFRGHGLGKAGDLAKWTLLFVLVNQLAYAVVVNLATNAGKLSSITGEGAGIFAYSSAYLIFILPHSIFTVSVVTGLLPRMSRAAADGRLDAVRDDLSTGWRLTAVGTVFVAAAYVALGPDLTGVLFTANVSDEDARFIGGVTAAFALGLPAFSAQYVALRGFYAQEDTRTPFLLQVVIAAMNVLLALLAYAVLPERFTLVGLALAYSATYLVGLTLSAAVLRRRLGGVDGHRVTRTVVRLVLAVLPGAIAAWGFSQALTGWLGEGFAGSAVALGTGGVVLLLGFLTVGRALRIDELATVNATVRNRFAH